MTNSNGRNIAIVTGSALGLGYELTKQLIADGWFVAGIDTAFYRDSRDYVSEEKQHTFMDPGELAQVILFNLVNDANLTVSDILIERNSAEPDEFRRLSGNASRASAHPSSQRSSGGLYWSLSVKQVR